MKKRTHKIDINLYLLKFLFKRVVKKYLFMTLFFMIILLSLIFEIIIMKYISSEKYFDYNPVSMFFKLLLYKTILCSVFVILFSFMITQHFLFDDRQKSILSLEIKSGVGLNNSLLLRCIVIFSFIFFLIISMLVVDSISLMWIPHNFRYIQKAILTKYSFYTLLAIITVTVTFFLLNFVNEYLVYILVGVLSFFTPLSSFFNSLILDSNSNLQNIQSNSTSLNNNSLIYKKLYKLANNLNEDENFNKLFSIDFDVKNLKNFSILQGNLLNDDFMNLVEKKAPEFKEFLSYAHEYYLTKEQHLIKNIDFSNFIFNKNDNIINYDFSYFFNILNSFENNIDNIKYKKFINYFIPFSKEFLVLNSFSKDIFVDSSGTAKLTPYIWKSDINKYANLDEISLYYFISMTFNLLYNYSNNEIIETMLPQNQKGLVNQIKTHLYLNPMLLYNNITYGGMYNWENEQISIINNNTNEFLILRNYYEFNLKTNYENKTNYNILNYNIKNITIFSYEGFYIFLVLIATAILYLNYFRLKRILIE